MMNRDQWREFSQRKPVRTALFMTGLLLIILSPIAGAVPGPGGVFVFAAGLALALKNSDWAKRQYVHFKRKQPKAGRWADWGLRRQSAKRREELRKLRQQQQETAAAQSTAEQAAGARARTPSPAPHGAAEAGQGQQGERRAGD